MRVEIPAPDALVDRLLSRLDGATAPLAVVDPGWPVGLLADARRQLDAAGDDLRPDELVLFTSGSTGQARGVVRTVASWAASLEPLTRLTGIGRTDTVWLPVPLWSSLSLYGALHARWAGARLRQDADLPAAATAAHLVPPLLARACSAVERGAPTSLTTVVVAGAALEPALRARAERLGWRVLEYYGAAELSFVGWRDQDVPMADFPGVVTRVDAGELWASSPYLCRRYLAEEGAGALRRSGAWATVGDLATRSGTGWLVRGRGTAAVTTGGHTVLVEDVERAVAQVPGVLDVAALGRPHRTLGEQLVALVVLAGDVRRDRLDEAVAALPAPARPRRWLRADHIPRTVTGKIRRDELAALAAGLPALG